MRRTFSLITDLFMKAMIFFSRVDKNLACGSILAVADFMSRAVYITRLIKLSRQLLYSPV
jgi:hypothetical protein